LPDLVLLDIAMPDLGGGGLAQNCQKFPQRKGGRPLSVRDGAKRESRITRGRLRVRTEICRGG
jgi:CheY-like chemotaxis protein